MQTVIAYPTTEVFQPKGYLNASNAIELQNQLTSAVSSAECGRILVDMSQVESLDSAGLMALVSSLSMAQQLNRHFSLCSVAPSIRIIFELTQLDGIFEMFESRKAFEQAVA